MIHHYLAYGLNIASQLGLPGLGNGVTAEPDVLIKVGRKPARVSCGDRVEWVQSGTGQARLYCPDAVFDVRDGRDVMVTPTPQFEPYRVGLILVGPVLAMVLHQRGYLVLHASAVSHGGFTVAFMGPSGRGKSTAAAALQRRGFGVLADDIVAIDCGDRFARVVPGSPHLKLTPESAYALGWTAPPFSREHPLQEKWVVRDGSGTAAQGSVELSLLCEILPGDMAKVEVLSPSSALMTVVDNGYIGHSVLDQPGRAATHFQQVSRLCMQVHVLRLTRGFGFDQLDRVLDKLVEFR